MPNTLLVITAMPEEMALLSHQFHVHTQNTIYHLEFYESNFHGFKIITSISGIGKVNAAVCTALGIQRYRPKMVINIGASGGLHHEVKLGDVVVASMLKHYDANATQFGCALGQIPRMPAFYETDKTLMESLIAKQAQFIFKIFLGLVCSGDSFISDEAFGIELRKKFPEILALDMESCAVAQTCYQLGLEFCCIRGITDSANKGADKSYQEVLPLAMKNANSVFLELLHAIK